MKKLLIGLLTLSALNGYSATLTEAFYMESKEGSGVPDLLISVYDDGTCLSESDNYDGRKLITAYECEVTKTSFTNISGLKEIQCDPYANFNGFNYEPETAPLTREGDKIYLGGIEFVRAPLEVIKKYQELSPCTNAIYND